MNVGNFVYRNRWWIVALWIAAGGAAFFIPASNPEATERQSFLPESTKYRQAITRLMEAFPDNSGLSEAVVVLERSGSALTPDDLSYAENIASKVTQPSAKVSAEDLAGVKVRSPGSLAVLGLLRSSEGSAPKNPMVSDVSPQGQAALVRLSVPHNYLTLRSFRIVEHVRGLLQTNVPPKGLVVSVTGSDGFGHDYAQAADRSYKRSSVVTLVAVVIILLLVYRAPLGALIPLGAISLAAVVVMGVFGLGQFVQMHVGTAERIFVFVLLYGAGTDYSLLLISRYREFLDAGMERRQAAADALSESFPTIFTSALTNATGLFMMTFADYGIFQTTGPSVATAMVVALLAAVTLVPALVGIVGPAQFWPGWKPLPPGGARKPVFFWPGLARAVTGRPALILVVTLGALAVPAWQATQLTWVYDTLTEMKATYEQDVGNAAAGVEAARRHWPVGEISPMSILVCNPTPLAAAQWEELSSRLSADLTAAGAAPVRSLTQPLGTSGTGLSGIAKVLASGQVRKEYLSADGKSMRLSAVLNKAPFSLEAMEALRGLRGVVEKSASVVPGVQVHIAGATAEMTDVRMITQRDFYRIAMLTLGVIFVLVLILLRDWLLTAFMVVSTVTSYLATLGITYWVFADGPGAGLDWKVEVFLFVVLVAVGVDYSIFLAARIKQESRRLDVVQAVQCALVHTGPVISSCGLIMAATLGSMMAGDLKLLLQLGFAFALGMLVDTFIVRPLLLPAFAVLRKPRPAAS